MPVKNLLIPGEEMTWDPDSNVASNVPHRLLRADNLVPDENNKLGLRRGSTTRFTNATSGNVNVIYSTLINNQLVRMVQVGDNMYRTRIANGTVVENGVTYQQGDVIENGVSAGALDILRTGEDVVVCDDAYQIFWARGNVKQRFSDFSNQPSTSTWGLTAPTVAPTLSASAFTATHVADFGSAGETISGTFTYPDEGTGGAHATNITGYDGTTNGATSLTPTKATGRASVAKVYTATQNFSVLNGQPQADTDLFDLYCWLEEPRKVDKITIMFGMNVSTGDPFLTDYFYFEFKVKDQVTVNVKDPDSTGVAAYGKAVDKIQSVVDPLALTKIKTPSQVKETLKRLGRFTGPRSRERVDSQQNSPAWTHFSVTRGRFNRVGGTPGKDWTTITAFKVVYTVLTGATDRVYLDSAAFFGGGDRALTGTYRGIYRFVRDSGVYIEMSPPSPVSTSITVTQGNITFTIPAAGVNQAGAANQIWLYLYGGFLDTFYRFAITSSAGGTQNLRLDEWTPITGSNFGTATKRGAAEEIGLSVPGGDTVSDSTIAVSLRKGELDVLIDNETLEPGVVGPPDDMIAAAGPWLNRLFCLTREGFLYPSSDTSPSNFSVWWTLDLRRYGEPKWMVKTNGGIVCGFTKDCVRIAGTGTMSEDKASLDFYPEPLGVGQPPVDKSVYTDGNTIVYRSADGLITLNGASATYMPTGNTSLLWRGFDRHGVSAANTATGRFRMTVDNGIVFVVVPEGTQTTATSIYRYYPSRAEWCRTTYTPGIRSIHREPNGSLLIGTDTGKVIELEIGTDDDNVAIPVTLLLPLIDAGQPLNRKRVFDAQVYVNTGGTTGTLAWLLEGSQNVSNSFTFSTPSLDVYRTAISVSDMSAWLKAQFRITGSFTTFLLGHLNFFYHARPPLTMALNTGYLLPANPGDVAWVQEVELDCIATEDIDALIYVDDVLYDTVRITVKPGFHTVYRVQVPQSYKGRRPHIIFRTISLKGVGEAIGFEPYGVRVRQRSSGNQVEAEFIPLYPVGQED